MVATITGHGAKDLVGLTLVGSGGGGPPADETITATDGHLFLTADGVWVPAKDLQVGDQLVDPDGTPVTIAAVEHGSVLATVHNLTVDTDHTYTVVTADGTDVVTHNEKPDLRGATGRAQSHCNVNSVTRAQADDIATHLGYTKTKQRSATGAAVWENRKAGSGQPRFITWDRNGHKGGIFKGSDDRNPFQTTSKAGRDGTFDVDIDSLGNLRGLTRVGS